MIGRAMYQARGFVRQVGLVVGQGLCQTGGAGGKAMSFLVMGSGDDCV